MKLHWLGKTKTAETAETAEQAYRRGYRDGWVRAVDSMHDLMFRQGMNRQEAYGKCFDHFEGALCDWIRDDDSHPIAPPEIGGAV